MAVKGNIDDVNVNTDVIRTDLSGADGQLSFASIEVRTPSLSLFQTDSRTEPGGTTAGWNQAVSQQFGLSVSVMMVCSVVDP